MKETRDILTLFEALNSHEVFTPPRLARDMLSLLPASLWREPGLRLLDPCAKTGVFLRESFFLLYDGLSGAGIYEAEDGETYDLSDHQQRINHILKNMLFGVATSELTGYMSRRTLYGVMEANVRKEDAAFDSFIQSESFARWSEEEKYHFLTRNRFNEYFDPALFQGGSHKGFEAEGNIFYPADEVSERVETDGFVAEDMYFPFIEGTTKHPKILDIKDGRMKFDVIIGNPPYQVSDGGAQKSARPVYHEFVEQAISLSPRHLSMIIPARWYSGGKGLDKFRSRFLDSGHIKEIHDFPDTTDCFPGLNIRGGVCYFHWDQAHQGDCRVASYSQGQSHGSVTRPPKEHGLDYFIRYNKAIDILRKVASFDEPSFSRLVSAHKAFGLRTYVKGASDPFNGCVKLYQNRSIGYIDRADVPKRQEWIDRWKVIVPYSSPGDDSYPHRILSAPLVSEPGSCSTETYLVVGPFGSKSECENVRSYMKTMLVRFLILLIKPSQHVTQKTYQLVPMQDFDQAWTDDALYQKYGITEDEIEFIHTLVKPI